MKFWGNLIIIVVTATIAYSLEWGTPSWLPIKLDWDIKWWVPAMFGMLILQGWSAMCNSAKQHNADLEELNEAIVALRQLLSIPPENAWGEIQDKIRTALESNRSPIFWEKWFELQDIIKDYQDSVSDLPKAKQKLQDNPAILGKTDDEELPPEEKISAWFQEIYSVLDKLKEKALEDLNFHTSYLAVNQTRKQDAHNKRMESIAKETAINAKAAVKAAEKAAGEAKTAADKAKTAADDAAEVKRNQT